MRIVGSLLFGFLFSLVVFSQFSNINLEEHHLLDNQLSILIPKDFAPMKEDMLKFKYPSERRPTQVYTNERGSVNIVIEHTSDQITLADLEGFHQMAVSLLKKTSPSATWFRNESKTINERKFFLLDFRTPAADTEVRNIMLGTSLNGRLLIISVNTSKALEDTWVPIANQIVESIKITDSH